MNAAPPRLLPDAGAPAEALINEARRHQHRRYLLIGLAAVAMLAGAAGVTVSQIRSGSQPPGLAVSGFSFAGAPASYSSAPVYYAYAVSGDTYDYFSQGTGTLYSGSVPGRYLKIRDTGTGKLLARISPPKPYNDFALFTGDASGRTFVVAAMRYWDRGGSYSAKLAERTLRTPMTFLLLHIAPGTALPADPARSTDTRAAAEHRAVAGRDEAGRGIRRRRANQGSRGDHAGHRQRAAVGAAARFMDAVNRWEWRLDSERPDAGLPAVVHPAPPGLGARLRGRQSGLSKTPRHACVPARHRRARR